MTHLSMRFTGAIASAVAGEINRLEQHPGFQQEGAAYKAAWDRQGSNALKHCESFRRDCLTVDAFRALRESGIRTPDVIDSAGAPV